MMPTFVHDGISFRTVEENDLAQIAAFQNDYTTWSFFTDRRLLYPGTWKEWLLGLKGSVFVAFDSVNPFIALVRIDEYDRLNSGIRVGVDIRVDLLDYNGKIYEAIKKYCFGHLNVHRVWLLALETNKRALKLCKKQGFRVEGKQRQAVFRDGKYLDLILMSMLEDEYRPRIQPGRQRAARREERSSTKHSLSAG